MGFVIPLHGKPRSLECSLRLLSFPANSKNTKTYPFSPPPPIFMSCGCYFIHICNLLLSLCSGLGVERTHFFLPLALKKKRKSKYHQPSFRYKCMLNLEQQHTFGISSYFVVLGVLGFFCFLLFCLFFVLGGAFVFSKEKRQTQLFILNIVVGFLFIYLVCMSSYRCIFSLLWPIYLLTHNQEWSK